MTQRNELSTKITADDSDFTKAIGHATRAAKQFGSSIADIGSKINTALGVAALASITGLAYMIGQVTDSVSKLNDEARSLGTSVASLQKLQYAVGLAGISSDELEGAMTRVAKSVRDAGDSSSSASRALSKLGLSASTLSSMSVDEQYIAIVDSLGKVKNQADQTDISLTLFGKGGLKQLKAVRDEIGKNAEEFEKFGGSLTESQVASIDDFGDSIDKLKAIFGAFSNQLTASLAPALQEFLKYIEQAIIDAGGLGTIGQKVGNALLDGVKTAVIGFQNLVDSIRNIKLAFTEARLEGLRLLQMISRKNFEVFGGDYNFDRDTEILKGERQLEKDRAQPMTDYSSKLLEAVYKAKATAEKNATDSITKMADASSKAADSLASVDKLRDILGLGEVSSKEYIAKGIKPLEQYRDADFDKYVEQIRNDLIDGELSESGENKISRLRDIASSSEKYLKEGQTNTAMLQVANDIRELVDGSASTTQQKVIVDIRVDKNGLLTAFSDSTTFQGVMDKAVMRSTANEAHATVSSGG